MKNITYRIINLIDYQQRQLLNLTQKDHNIILFAFIWYQRTFYGMYVSCYFPNFVLRLTNQFHRIDGIRMIIFFQGSI